MLSWLLSGQKNSGDSSSEQNKEIVIDVPVIVSHSPRIDTIAEMIKPWVLVKHSSICYRLYSVTHKENFIFYIKPYIEEDKISYILSVKQTNFPRIQTLSKFHDLMNSYGSPIIATENSIGLGGNNKDSCSLFLSVEGTQIIETLTTSTCYKNTN